MLIMYAYQSFSDDDAGSIHHIIPSVAASAQSGALAPRCALVIHTHANSVDVLAPVHAIDGVGAGNVEPKVIEVVCQAHSVHGLEALVAELAHAFVCVVLAVWVHLQASAG